MKGMGILMIREIVVEYKLNLNDLWDVLIDVGIDIAVMVQKIVRIILSISSVIEESMK